LRGAVTAVTIAEMGGHDTETLGHDEPKLKVGHDVRNARSRCRNQRSRCAEIRTWRNHYNEVRPYSSLQYLTPSEFKLELRKEPQPAVF